MGAAEIMDAKRERGALATTLHLLLGEFDLLATPAVAIPAFAAGVEVPDPARQRRWIDWAGFSYPFNLSQQPAISVPCGRTKAGLPIGLQLVARKYREDLVLRAALAFERAEPAAAAGGAPPCAGLTLPEAHAWLRVEQRFLGRVDVDGWCQAGSARHGVGPGARHDGRGQDAGLLLGRQPGRLQPAALHSGTTFDASSRPVYNRLFQAERGTTTIEPALAESYTSRTTARTIRSSSART